MKCKVGDLCFIVVSREQPENLGKVVEVVEYLGYVNNGELIVYNDQKWRARVSDHFWAVKGNMKTQMGACVELHPKSDSSLSPIKGEPIEDTESFIKELNLELVK